MTLVTDYDPAARARQIARVEVAQVEAELLADGHPAPLAFAAAAGYVAGRHGLSVKQIEKLSTLSYEERGYV